MAVVIVTQCKLSAKNEEFKYLKQEAQQQKLLMVIDINHRVKMDEDNEDEIDKR